jgi:mRNA-degrading endonuclease toxin of MazEF toxin-antitoxin module
MRRGEVWNIDLGETRGHEQAGSRPGIVIGDSSGIIQVIPLTSNLDRADFPNTMILYPDRKNGLNIASVALVFQITSLDKERFSQRLGTLSHDDIDSIDHLLRDLLGL